MQSFRRMTEEDIDEVAALEEEIFPDAWTSKSIYETYCQRQAFIAVSEDNGRINGYCIIYYVLDEGEIARIAVKKEDRHKGVGRGILEYICDVCREKGVECLLLDVRESNVNARKFYRNYGFAEDGIRKKFYEKPVESAILMSKIIG